MAAEKPSVGAKARTNPLLRDAATVSDVLDMRNQFKAGQLSRPARPAPPNKLGSDFVKVRNDTGGDRERGDCLQLGSYLLTDASEADLHNLWFAADRPECIVVESREIPTWKCVILQHALPEDAIGPAHASGVCVAKVNVTNVLHTHATPYHQSYVLISGYSGMFELLQPPDGTGEQLLIVRFAQDRPPTCIDLFTSQDTWNGTPSTYIATLGNVTGSGGFSTDFQRHNITFGSNTITIIEEGLYHCSLGVSISQGAGTTKQGNAYLRKNGSTMTSCRGYGETMAGTSIVYMASGDELQVCVDYYAGTAPASSSWTFWPGTVTIFRLGPYNLATGS